MKRIYVIVPKKLNTKPVMKVTAGYAMAQVHHATVYAANHFKLSPFSIVVVFQVLNDNKLRFLADQMRQDKIKHVIYLDEVSCRKNTQVWTAIVTDELKDKPKCLNRKKLF